MAAGINKQRHAILIYPGLFHDNANGSQVRATSLLQWLRANFTCVTLYAIDGYPEPINGAELKAAMARFYPDVEVVIEKYSKQLQWASKCKKLLQSINPFICGKLIKARIPRTTPKWEKLTAKPNSSLIFVNYTNTLFHLNGINPGQCIVETHDIQFLRKAKGPGRSSLTLGALMRFRLEFGILRTVAGAVGISRFEAYLIQNTAPETAVFYIPDYDQRPVKRLPLVDKRWDLLFIGSGNAINERGLVEMFARPDLDLGQYQIAISGNVCKLPSIKAIAATRKNVHLLGFVDDLEALYASSRACLCPTDGTGLNIKIVEALRFGRPVFASSSAMEALNAGHENCVFPVENSAMSAMLQDPADWVRASQASGEFYQKFVYGGDMGKLAEWTRGRAPCRNSGYLAQSVR